MTAPRYQDVLAGDIPTVTDDDGTCVRVICGSFWGKTGPIDGLSSDPRYLDVSVPPGKTKRLAVENPRHGFAYVFAGSGQFQDASDPQPVITEHVESPEMPDANPVENRALVLFDGGDEIVIRAGDEGIRFLLVSGKPIQEPVAWRGPIVMNTQEQLHQAFTELREGNFIKESKEYE